MTEEMTIELLDERVKKVTSEWEKVDYRTDIIIISDYLARLIRSQKIFDEYQGFKFYNLAEYKHKLQFINFQVLERAKLRDLVERDGFVFVRVRHLPLFELNEIIDRVGIIN